LGETKQRFFFFNGKFRFHTLKVPEAFQKKYSDVEKDIWEPKMFSVHEYLFV